MDIRYENATKKERNLQENSMSKIMDMLALFYANKHMNERIVRTDNIKKSGICGISICDTGQNQTLRACIEER